MRTHMEFLDWAERWERDIFRIAHRRGLRHGKIRSDAELSFRSLARRLKSMEKIQKPVGRQT